MIDIFTSKEQIEKFLKETDDYDKTKGLIKDFEELKKNRNPFYLTSEELEKILEWKLITQFGRQKKIRGNNTQENIILITKTAFLLTHEDKDIETSLRLRTLSLLAGVEIAVASAILTLCFPKQYGVIDFRNWRQIFGDKKTSHTTNQYNEYLKEIKPIASKFGFTIQEIDAAIWQKDKEENM